MAEEFNQEEGIKLVNEFSEVKAKLAELKKQEEDFREKLIQYAKQFGINAISGTNKIATLKSYQKVIYPEDKTEIIRLLKEKGLWDEFSMINYSRFQSRAVKGEIDPEIKNKIDLKEDWRVALKDKKEVVVSGFD